MQGSQDFAKLQQHAFPLYSAIEGSSSSPLEKASAAFIVGSDVLYLVETIPSVNDYKKKDPNLTHLPTRITTRNPKAEKIVLRNSKAPDASAFIALLQDFIACFTRGDPKTVLTKADALMAFTLQCIAYFLSQGGQYTEQEWWTDMNSRMKIDRDMWYTWTKYYDKLPKPAQPM